MHPNLVAGAWVGFNDNRVNMRSAYWGQGGHNAILLVGDFFKTALDSGKLDKAAQFPGGPKIAPVRPQDELEVMEEGGDLRQEGVPQAEEAVQPSPEPEQVIDEPPPERRQDRQVRDRDAEVDRQIQLDRQLQQQLDRQNRQQPERQFQPDRPPPPDRQYQPDRPPPPDRQYQPDRPPPPERQFQPQQQPDGESPPRQPVESPDA
jgi:penicillin-binding protein 1A